MRRAFVASAALALAACKLDYEGAPCRVPALVTDECPTGQACGNDGKCSTRAAACAEICDTAARPAPVRCRAGGAAAEIQTCGSADPLCGTWTVTTTCVAGLVCGGTSAAPACACADAGTVLRADPTAPVDPTLTRTGADAPPACRFRKLGDALAAAAALGSAATVNAYGDAGNVEFTGETFPLDVAPDVTLVGATGASIATIRGDGAASSILTVRGGLERVQIVNDSMTGTGVALQCGTAPSLADVGVSSPGAARLATGISVSGSCDAELRRVDVSGASTVGLDLKGTGIVTVRGGSFHGNAIGVRISSGTLALGDDVLGTPPVTTASAASDNAGDGLLVTGTDPVAVTLTNASVERNAGRAVAVEGSGAADVTLEGARISAPSTADAIAIATTDAGTVSVAGSALVTGGRNGISISHAGTATVGVSLGEPGQVTGAAGSGDGIAITSTGTGGAITLSLVGAAVTGRGQNGIAISNGGAATVTAALARNATTGTDARVTANGGSGVVVTGSGPVVLSLSDAQVTDNAGSGIGAVGTGQFDLALTNVLVSGNGGTGVVVASVSATSAFTMAGCDVHSNAKALPTQYGSPLRNAGGILISPQGAFQTFGFRNNLVYANPPTTGTFAAADQLAFASGTGWRLDSAVASQCGLANAIGCLRATAYSLNAVDPVTVDARYTTWPPTDPAFAGFVSATPACGSWTAACP